MTWIKKLRYKGERKCFEFFIIRCYGADTWNKHCKCVVYIAL